MMNLNRRILAGNGFGNRCVFRNANSNVKVRFIHNNRKIFTTWSDIESLPKDSEYQYLINKIKGDKEFKRDVLNSPRTLPAFDVLDTREKIRQDLIKEKDGQIGPFGSVIVYYRFMKKILEFFKIGMVNVVKTYFDLRKSVFSGNRYIFDYSLGDKDGKLALRKKDKQRIIDELVVKIRNMQVEFENGVRTKEDLFNPDEIRLTRKEYQEILRNSKDFWKVPLFGLILVVFEELSIILFALFPKVLPSTCVLPGMVKNAYYKKSHTAQIQLEKLQKWDCDIGLKNIENDSPWNMNRNEVLLTLEMLNINKGIVRTEAVLRRKLLEWEKEIYIDNYLILRDGGVFNLSHREVLSSCYARGLVVADVKDCDADYQFLRKVLAVYVFNRAHVTPAPQIS